MAVATSPACWYEDPWHTAAQRWWDGSAWTGHVAGAGSILDCDSVSIALDLLSRTCRLTDSQGTVIGSLDTAGSSSAAPGMSAAPQAGELQVATLGDMNTPPPPQLSQPAFATPQPVPIRDVDGRPLFTVRPNAMGQSSKSFTVRVHGPDETELGRYDTGAGGGKTVELLCGEQRVATIARDATRGTHKQMVLRGMDGTPFATLAMGERSASATSLSLTVTVVPPLSGPVRHLAVMMPVAFIATAITVMSAMPVMPPMAAGAAGPMATSADMGGRLMGAMIGGLFDSLGGS